MSGFLYRVLSFIMDKLAIRSTNKIGFSNWEMNTNSLRGGTTCSTAGRACRDAVGFSWARSMTLTVFTSKQVSTTAKP